MLALPEKFEELIQAFVKKTYYANTRKKDFADREFSFGDYRFFMKGVAKLNAFFTSDRSERPRDYFNQKELRSGYLLYFLPVNALKISALMKQLPQSFFEQPLNVLDLGCGPATATIGSLLSQRIKIKNLTLVDQNKIIIKEGRELINKMAAAKLCEAPNNIQCLTGALHQKSLPPPLKGKRFDLIFLANTLNEIPQLNTKLRLIQNLIRFHLSKNGYLLIVEPALRTPSRELMELRDALLENEIAHVHAPCLHQENCPMLADSGRDWCHMYWEWKRPPLIETMDHLVEIRKDYLKASYLLLNTNEQKTNKQHWRVVSGRLNSKGKSERLLCGLGDLPHLRRLTRLDRDASTSNKDFEQAQRGDIITTEANKRVGKKDKVTIVL